MTLQNFTLGTFAQGAAGGGGAFESIASASGTGSSTTITFSSIPGTYQHLQIRYIARTTATFQAGSFKIYWNGSESTYARHDLQGSGSAVSANGSANQTNGIYLADVMTGASATANQMGVGIIDLHDYASSTKNVTMRIFCGNDRNGSGVVYLGSGFRTTAAAITSISVVDVTGGNFSSDTRFALYGIKGA